MATKQAQKTCFIKTRYFVKSTGTVCARIVNEKNIEYTSCIFKDGRSSCTCPHHPTAKCPECYHVKHLRASEAQRNNHTEQDTRTPAQPLVETETQQEAHQTAVSTSQDTTLILARDVTPIVARKNVSTAELSLSAFGLMRGQNEKKGGWLASC